jgi:Tol biopolymer transport system component
MLHYLTKLTNLLKNFGKIIFAFATILCFSFPLYSQVEGITQRPFGKNRVQFQEFDWRMKTTTNFEVYYYDFGSAIADFALLYAESEFDRITTLLGHNPTAKTKLFIYNSVSDLQQSNVGLANENSRTIGGQTNFIKPKIEIPFTGSLYEFKKEISFGIAQIFVNEMMYGGNIREILKNGALLILPDWFMPGVAAFVADAWSSEMDDYMRNSIEYPQLKRPHKLVGKEAMLVGQSIWNYIAIKYGENNISNILNLTRIIRSEKDAIASTLGISYEDFIEDWRNFYLEMAKQAKNDYEALDFDTQLKKQNHKRKTYNEVKISPNGKFVAYSENRNGHYTVVVRNLDNMKRKVVFRGGFRLNAQRINEKIPLLAWSDDNQLVICYKHKNKTRFRILKVGERKVKKLEQLQFEFFNQVTGFDISADGSVLAISSDRIGSAGVQAGSNDLYLYTIRERFMKRLTNDLYDDTDPVFVGKSNEILVFASNRPADSLNVPPGDFRTIGENYDLFYYNPQESANKLVRLTNAPHKELYPVMFDEQTAMFLSEQNGISNLFSVNLISKEVRQLTNSRHSIQKFSVAERGNLFAFRSWHKRKEKLMLKRNFDFSQNRKSIPTSRILYLKQKGLLPEQQAITDTSAQEKQEEKAQQPAEPDYKPEKPYNPEEIDTDDYQFDPEVVKDVKEKMKNQKNDNLTMVSGFSQRKKQNKNPEIRGAYPYEPLFTTESSVSTPFIDPIRGFGLLFEMEVSDLLENHRMKGGLLGLFDLRSANYFAEYQYLANRLDLIARYDRKSIFANNPSVGIAQRYASNRFTLTASYPFTNSMRVSLTGGYMDRRSVNLLLLTKFPEYISYLHTRAEFNFDNTILKGANMVEGTRAKIYYEFNPSFSHINEGFDKLMLDIRHYQSLHKEITFATRFSAGAFGGRSPKRFMLGGVDNNLSQQAGLGGNPPLDISFEQGNPDVLFHEFATNLRGFNFNSQNGKYFMLLNAELRVPIIKYLLQNSISSNFFKNLQFIAFGDFGSAWNNTAPWNRQNDVNTQFIDTPPFTIIVNNFKSPFLASYGWGFRTTFLGYYLKADIAWKVEDFVVTPRPVWVISMGYDF